ncbi:site-specific DNA-methyltransferase (adenine-specific) [Duganella sp. SG902]|uniref:DNA-methyltransferase n=1 Tax=Duganella sp. SG902 TaxID=2587016 RepID=UPI00183B2EED|nr:site-specific DNA-methyltransferase (adenine-specific) [Duganella sp. SG902]
MNTESNNAPIPAYPLNQLHQVDALHLVSNLPDESLDMLLTDPPYSSGGLHVGARTKTTSKKYINSSTKAQYQDFISDNMDQRSWQFWCHAWLSQARRALKPGGIVVCCIDWRQLPALTDVVQAAGFTLQGVAVWDKTPGRYRPRRGGFAQQAEFIVWASKGALPQREVYLPGVFQARLEMPKQHLTEKPLDMARQIVRLVPPGGVVCDLFAGCGTFLLAAKEAGLPWVGSELDGHYHQLASKRLAAVKAPPAAELMAA